MNKEIVENYADSVWNKKDLNVIDQIIHEKTLIHSLLGNYYGPNAMKQVVQAWLKGFPDLQVKNIGTFTDDDKVALQWEAFGTHQGEFKGIAPSGNAVSYSGVTIYRISEGKIIEYWAYLDMQHLLDQIHKK